MKKLLAAIVLLSVFATLAGCGGSGTDETTPPPTTREEPAAITYDATTKLSPTGHAGLTAALAPADGSGKRTITLSAIKIPVKAGETEYTGLTASDFGLWIDGKEYVITVEPFSSTVASKADIAFAIDATGSMSGQIRNVQDSIIAFADYLTTAGLDVKFAGVDFYDRIGYTGYDIAAKDIDVASKIKGINLDVSVEDFKTWVDGLYATSGGDGPEVSVDAIYELNSRVKWRAGAQRIIIAFTDVTSHQRDDGTDYALWTGAETINACLGKTVVHTASPAGTIGKPSSTALGKSFIGNDGKRYSGALATSTDDYDISEIAKATGGLDLYMTYGTKFDLSSLSIKSTIASGYRITFTDPGGALTRARLVFYVSGSPVSDIILADS